MPLFGRKKQAPPAPEPVIYSLPMIRSQSTSAIADAMGLKASFVATQGKAPISGSAPVAFHKPTSYRPSIDLTADRRKSAAYSIASMYAGHQTAPGTPTGRTPPMPKRVARLPPSFNLIVTGQANTGKTAFLKTLLSQSVLPSSTPEETKAAMAHFGCNSQGKLKATTGWSTFQLDVLEKGERLNLTVLDTPGFELNAFDDFDADVTVNEVLKHVEQRYLESLQSESQVVRTNAKTSSDHHIHLVLYFLHPSSFAPPSRRATGLLRRGTKKSTSRSIVKAKSSPTLRDRRESQTSSQESKDDSVDDVEELGVHPTDLKLIKKLSKRVNVLPIIARADELTSARLAEIRAAVSRDFRREGLTFGVLHFDDGANHANGDNASIPPTPSLPDFLPTSASMSKSISAPEMSSAAADPPAATNGDSLQPPKLVRTRSRSFSRRKTLANLELDLPTPSTAALQRSLPFAVIAPEVLPGQVFDAMPLTRTYPWGKIDVLSPEHSDHQLARSSILSVYMKAFREQTKTLYEDYRTGKLLAKRATLTPVQQRQVLAELQNI